MERAQHLQSVPRYVQHYRRFNCGSPSVDLDLIRCVDLFLGASDEIGPENDADNMALRPARTEPFTRPRAGSTRRVMLVLPVGC